MALSVGREHHSSQQNPPDGAIVRFRLVRSSAGPSGIWSDNLQGVNT